MLDIPLNLSPRYQVTLTLSADDGQNLNLSADPADLLLQAAAVLRGERGPAYPSEAAQAATEAARDAAIAAQGDAEDAQAATEAARDAALAAQSAAETAADAAAGSAGTAGTQYPQVLAMASQLLGMTAAQVDQMFIAAAKL